MRLFLVQCGQTEWQAEARMQGPLSMPLTAIGREQAEAAARRLADQPLSAVYSPDDEACLQTARAIAKAHRGCKVRKLDDLAELDPGLWQGMRLEQIRQRQPKVFRQWQDDPASVTPPQGEGFAAALRRCADAIDTIVRRGDERAAAAVVAPPMIAGLVRCHLTRSDLSQAWRLMVEHPAEPEHFDVVPAEKQ